MGLDTKAIIRKGTPLDEIKDALSQKYTDVQVHETSIDDFYSITFSDKSEKRKMFVSYGDSVLEDYGIDGVGLSLGFWGNSVEIMHHLCETFGGYLDENDCDDQEFYPINHHLFLQEADTTPMELFKTEVMEKLGYSKLSVAMELFEKYSKILKENPETCPDCSNYGIIQDEHGQNSTCPCHLI